MHRSKWCNRKRSVGVTAHVIAPASKFSDCRSFSHLFFFTILPVKRTQETRNIHSSTLLSTSMATKGCGIFCISFSCPRSRSWTHRIVAGHTTTFHHFANFQDTGLETEHRFPAKPPSGNRGPIWAGHGGNRASDLLLTSLGPDQLRHIWVASPSIQERLLHSHPSPATQIQTPKSKIQTGRLDFGFWILEFGVWILDFGSWILDFGFWIVVVSVLFVSAPNAAVWILDFGFWILDLGFWILDFGFWILDFGFWILDFGFWILDFGFCFYGTVWILHKIIGTTRRLGSADYPGRGKICERHVGWIYHGKFQWPE